MTNPDRLVEALGLMIAEIEDCAAEERRLRRALEGARLKRARMTAAIDPAIGHLPAARADALRTRLSRAVHDEARSHARREKTRLRAILDFLAEHDSRVIRVVDVTEHLTRAGFRAVPPGYASETLKRLAAEGVCTRVRHGRYRTNENHRAIIDYHTRAFETAIGEKPPVQRVLEPEDGGPERPVPAPPEPKPEPTPEQVQAEHEARLARLATARTIMARGDAPNRDPQQQAAETAFLAEWRKELGG